MKAHQLVAVKGLEEVGFILRKAPPTASLFRITPQGNCLYYRIEGHEYQVYFPLNSEWWFSSIQEASEFLDIEELKLVVESIEMVQQSGGFEVVKSAITNYRASGDMVTFSSIEERLADYELVEFYKGASHE